MKITTEKMTIEANAEELRQSNNLAESFAQVLRKCFNGSAYQEEEEEEDEEEAGEEQDGD